MTLLSITERFKQYADGMEQERQGRLDQEFAETHERHKDRFAFTRGLMQGVAQTQGMMHGAIGMAKSVVGEDSAQDSFMRAGHHLRRAEAYAAPVQQFWSKDSETGAFGSIGNLGSWAASTAGQLIPFMTEIAVTGAITGGAGSVAGGAIRAGAKKGLQGAIAKRATAELLEQTAKRFAAKGMAGEAAKQAAATYVKENAKALIPQAIKATTGRWGANVGVIAASGSLEGGGMWTEAMEKGIDNPYSAMALGLVSGASEVFLGNAPRAIRGVFGRGVANTLDEVAKAKGPRMAAGYLWDVVKNMGEEGAQEVFQEILSSINMEINDPEHDMFTREGFMAWAEAGAAGAMGGLIFGAPRVTSQMIGKKLNPPPPGDGGPRKSVDLLAEVQKGVFPVKNADPAAAAEAAEANLLEREAALAAEEAAQAGQLAMEPPPQGPEPSLADSFPFGENVQEQEVGVSQMQAPEPGPHTAEVVPNESDAWPEVGVENLRAPEPEAPAPAPIRKAPAEISSDPMATLRWLVENAGEYENVTIGNLFDAMDEHIPPAKKTSDFIRAVQAGQAIYDQDLVRKGENLLDMPVRLTGKVKEAAPKPETATKPPAPKPKPKPVGAPPENMATSPRQPGETVKTFEGRDTTPYPKVDFSTNVKAINTKRRVDEWLKTNAIAEAQARGDDFNLRQFENSGKPGLISIADQEAMEAYLFTEQPAVIPPFTKPLVKPQEAKAEDKAPKAEPQEAKPKASPQEAFQTRLERRGHAVDAEGTAFSIQGSMVADDSFYVQRTSAEGERSTIGAEKQGVSLEEARQVALEHAVFDTKPKEEPAVEATPKQEAKAEPDIYQMSEAEIDTLLFADITAEGEKVASESKPKKATQPEAPAAKQAKKAAEPIPGKTLSEKAAEARLEMDAAGDALRKFLAGKTFSNPLADPELVALTTKWVAKSFKAGVYSFADLVHNTVELLGEAMTRNIGPVIEVAWTKLRTYDTKKLLSETGNVNEILDAIAKEGTTDGATIDSGMDQTGSEQRDEVGGRRRGDAGKDAGVLGDTPAQDVPVSEDAGSPQDVRDDPGRKDDSADARNEDGGKGSNDGRPRAGSDRLADDGAGGGQRPRGDSGHGVIPNGASEHRPNSRNYRIKPEGLKTGGGSKTRFVRNQEAIEILHRVLDEGRLPTEAERDAMAEYIGWGSFGQPLFNGTWEYPAPHKDWKKEDAWLRAHLGEEAWKSAQASIVNAHYTDVPTVQAIWDVARSLGFEGGNILEPAMGTGNFFGLMPDSIAAKSTLHGIELDQTAGQIAQLLYPDANINIKGYQEHSVPEGFYDLVIGNWPFSKVGPADPKYDNLKLNLHNYFFVKALDQVRVGGLVIGLSSYFTMDSVSPKARHAIAQKADLVASFRLPSGAFGEYAGTNVVTDLIILKKRDPAGIWNKPSWLGLQEVRIKPTQEFPKVDRYSVNAYYAQNPDHVLGDLSYGHGTTTRQPGKIVNMREDYPATLQDLGSRVPKDTYKPPEKPVQHIYEVDNTGDRFRAISVDEKGDLYISLGSVKAPLQFPPATASQVADLARIRVALGAVIDAQMKSAENTETLRATLRQQHEAFVEKYGPVNESDGLSRFKATGDPYLYHLANLERNANQNPKGKPKWVPATILSESTVIGRAQTKDLSTRDAWLVQRGETMRYDADRVAEMSNKTPEEVTQELVDANAIYYNPAGHWDYADEYLSGNVRLKLKEAKEAKAAGVEGMERNIKALEKVVPPETSHFNIEVKLGNAWMSNQDYVEFIADLFEIPAEKAGSLINVHQGLEWKVDLGPQLTVHPIARDQWGHPSIRFDHLLTKTMNNSPIKITMLDKDKNRVLDEKTTALVVEKAERLREKFSEWAWADPERKVRLTDAFNQLMNNYADPQYDGEWLAFDGMTVELGESPFQFRLHQRSAVARGLINGSGLYAHEVGTGKTFIMAALAIEARKLGIAKKPVLFARNSNYQIIGQEINQVYPGAKVLVVSDSTKKDPVTGQSRRKSDMAQMVTGDWDVIVMPHSMLENNVTLRKETLLKLAEKEIALLEEEAIAAAMMDGHVLTVEMMDNEKTMKGFARKSKTAKQLVLERDKIINRILRAANAKETENMIFADEAGIDMVILDEAHVAKKPPIATSQEAKGLNKESSSISVSAAFLTDYVNMINGGKGVHFFTGTPVTNTLNEVYNMMRYVMPHEMEKHHIRTWTQWFNAYADVVTNVEVDSAGEHTSVSRLSKFVNLDSLRKIMGQYMDVVFAKDMPEFTDRQTKKGKTYKDELTLAEKDELQNGRTEGASDRPYKEIRNVIIPMTPQQEVIRNDLRRLSYEWDEASGMQKQKWTQGGDPHSPLLINTAASKAGVDARMYDLGLADEGEASKIGHVVKNVIAHYNEHGKACQAIFMEAGFKDVVTRTKTTRDPAGNKRVEKRKVRVFNVAQDVVNKLVAHGIPRQEIAVVTADTKPAQRAQIAEQMNNGTLRVIIGSSGTVGTGMNFQKNLRAMHHLDAPWMPGELEQRNGRGHRQGNQWNTVMEYRYITEGMDGKRWQLLMIKQKFISDFMHARSGVYVVEADFAADVGDAAAEMMESLAGAVGDGRVLQKETLERAVQQLIKRRDFHAQGVREATRKAAEQRESAAVMEKSLETLRAELAKYDAAKEAQGGNFEITLDGFKYDKRKDADEALEKLHSKYYHAHTKIGEYLGFDLMGATKGTRTRLYVQTANFKVDIGYGLISAESQHDFTGVQSLESKMRNFKDRVPKLEQALQQSKASAKSMGQQAKEPFGQAEQLEKKRARLADIERDIQQNPHPAPYWLRQGAPSETAIWVDGNEMTVTGHRWSERGWFVLAEDNAGVEQPVPYDKVRNEQGMRLYEDKAFQEPPKPKEKKKPGDQPQPGEPAPGPVADAPADPQAPQLRDVAETLSPANKARLNALGKRLFGDEWLRLRNKVMTPSGREVMGRYQSGWADISTGKGDPKSTVLHEAVHRAEDLFLTDTELADLKRAEPDSEKRAEGIVRYAKDGEGLVGKARQMAARLLRRLRAFMGNQKDRDALFNFYDNLLAGEYAKRGQVRQGQGQAAHRPDVQAVRDEIKALRKSVDALGQDPLTEQPWSESYMDWYGDEWGEAEQGIFDNYVDDLVYAEEAKLGRATTEAERDALYPQASQMTEEFIKEETRKRFYPEMTQVHDTMEKVLDLYDEAERLRKSEMGKYRPDSLPGSRSIAAATEAGDTRKATALQAIRGAVLAMNDPAVMLEHMSDMKGLRQLLADHQSALEILQGPKASILQDVQDGKRDEYPATWNADVVDILETMSQYEDGETLIQNNIADATAALEVLESHKAADVNALLDEYLDLTSGELDALRVWQRLENPTWEEDRVWRHIRETFPHLDPEGNALDMLQAQQIANQIQAWTEGKERGEVQYRDPDKAWGDSAKSAWGWVKDFMNPPKDTNARPEYNLLDTLLRSPVNYMEKVPSAQRVLEAAEAGQDAVGKEAEKIFGIEEQGLVGLHQYAKAHKEEWGKVSQYILERDREAVSPFVRKAEDGKGYVVMDPTGQKIIARAAEEFDALNTIFDMEGKAFAKAGYSADAVDALRQFRVIMARAYDQLRGEAYRIRAELEAAGIEVPPLPDGTDLFSALEKMGDQRGHYFPRLRTGGKFMLQYEKDGAMTLEKFATAPLRSARAATLKQEGIEVTFRIDPKPSEEAYLDASLVAMNDIIQTSIQQMDKPKTDISLADFGMQGRWVDYARKDGAKERHFVLEGPYNKKWNSILVEFGGRRYDDKQNNLGEVWHFANPSKNIQNQLAKALHTHVHGSLRPMEAFAKTFFGQVAEIIHARASRQRKIGRSDLKGEYVWRGYNENVLEATAMAGRSIAGGTAKGKMAKAMMDAFMGTDIPFAAFKRQYMDQNAEATGAEVWQAYQTMVNERRIDSAVQPLAYKDTLGFMREMLRNPEPHERVMNTVRGVAALKFLSGVAPGVVNLTTLSTSVPASMKHFGNIPLRKSARLVAAGVKDYVKHYMHTRWGKGEGMKGDINQVDSDAWLFHEISSRGWDNSFLESEAIRILKSQTGQLFQRIIEKALIVFTVTERINRGGTIAAAYRGMREQGVAPHEALHRAKKITDKAHAVYGKINRPSWARGSTLGSMTAQSFYTYKQYSHQYMQVLAEYGFARDWKAFAWQLLSPAILAGPAATLATPALAFAIKGVFAGIGKQPPDDPEEEFYRWIESEMGGTAGRFARTGLFGGALGVNLKGSLAVGLGDLPTDFKSLLGAPYSLGQDVLFGMEDLAKGRVMKGAEKLTPRAVASIVRGVREYTEGATTARSQPIYYENDRLRASGLDAILRGLSFNPASMSIKREKQWKDRQVEERYAQQRTAIYDRVRQFAAQGGARGDWANILLDVEAYNRRARNSGFENVPFITESVLKSTITRVQTPHKRERIRAGTVEREDPGEIAFNPNEPTRQGRARRTLERSLR